MLNQLAVLRPVDLGSCGARRSAASLLLAENGSKSDPGLPPHERKQQQRISLNLGTRGKTALIFSDGAGPGHLHW